MAFSNSGRHFEKALNLLHRAELHDPLDASAVIPAAVEDHDFARGRQMPHVALDIHLRLLAFGRRGQRDDAKNTRADAFGDRLDHPALAGAVAAFEHNADFEALGDDPKLQLDEFAMQTRQFPLIGLVVELLVSLRAVPFVRLTTFALTFCLSHASLPYSSFTTQGRLPSKGAEGSDAERRCEGGAFAAASRDD